MVALPWDIQSDAIRPWRGSGLPKKAKKRRRRFFSRSMSHRLSRVVLPPYSIDTK